MQCLLKLHDGPSRNEMEFGLAVLLAALLRIPITTTDTSHRLRGWTINSIYSGTPQHRPSPNSLWPTKTRKKKHERKNTQATSSGLGDEVAAVPREKRHNKDTSSYLRRFGVALHLCIGSWIGVDSTYFMCVTYDVGVCCQMCMFYISSMQDGFTSFTLLFCLCLPGLAFAHWKIGIVGENSNVEGWNVTSLQSQIVDRKWSH